MIISRIYQKLLIQKLRPTQFRDCRMKKIVLLLIGLTITIVVNGQIVKVQGGTSISKLEWKLNNIDFGQYDKVLIGHSIFAGIDYFDKKHFNLSSNLGMVRKGGKSNLQLLDSSGLQSATLIDKPTLDYLSINTTIDFKCQIKETIFPFISFGPRFDYLVNSSKHFNEIDEKNFTIGLILGGGIKYDIANLQFGLRADYYLDFIREIADWTIENSENGGKISVNTFTINLSVGYRLK